VAVQLEPGQVLSHYRIVAKLGQGGQATAYKAEDPRLNRLVVIKALRPELAQDEGARRRFEREATLCSALDNPNICPIYDIGEADGLSYIVMQFVEGPTLRQLMQGRPLDTATALSIAVQIADALAVAHAAGIVHRDIKPANVIVTPGGQAKVLDFGLAKVLAVAGHDGNAGEEPLTEVGIPYGSMGYGSPEQVSGEAVDHRSDIFSLGVVLYEMLAGQIPFKGKNAIEQLHAVMHDEPRPLRQYNSRVPPELEAIVKRALAKDPRERYQTMAGLRDALKAVSRRMTDTPSLGAMSRLRRRRRRAFWRFGGPLRRVFRRLRTATPLAAGAREPPAAAPAAPATPAASRPASWGTETKKTIAVLPFRNLAGDPETAFYEFSLADAVITELAQLRSLVVRPSSYVARYAGTNVDPRQVGEDLAVSSVLTGSFLKTRDRMRVSAQLVAAATGEILWSGKIDVADRDLITVQDAIAGWVISGLELQPTADERARIDRLPTRSAEAYEYYLRGQDLVFRYTVKTFDDADLDEAIRMFNEAVGLDDQFADAHAALGRCYVHHAQGYGGTEYYLLAERSLRRALELDPSLTEARLQMVHVDLYHGNKEHAEAAIEELRQKAPNDPGVLFVAAMLYRLDGLYARAFEAYDRLLELSPADAVVVNFNRARIYTHEGKLEEALAELERARAAEPDHPLVKTFLAVTLFNHGRIDEAQALVEEVLRQHPHLEGVLPVLAWCLSARGEHEAAQALITERVKETAAADHDIAFWLASFYAMEGRVDEAVEWVGIAVHLGNENYPLFARSPKLDAVRKDPRFEAVMAQLKQRWESRAAGAPMASSAS
jgi:eukaryotic-like serine/threonine-protein kinase